MAAQLTYALALKRRKRNLSILYENQVSYDKEVKKRRKPFIDTFKREQCILLNALAAVVRATPDRKFRETWAYPRSDERWQLGKTIWSEADFKRRFRISRELFNVILDELTPFLRKEDNRFRCAAPVDKKFGIYLYRLGRGVPYLTTADLFGVSEAAACIYANEVASLVVNHFYNNYVVLPSTELE